jgi:hypothetical protein
VPEVATVTIGITSKAEAVASVEEEAVASEVSVVEASEAVALAEAGKSV